MVLATVFRDHEVPPATNRIDVAHRNDPLSPTNREIPQHVGDLVSARRNRQLAFSQVEALSGDPKRLAFGGTTTRGDDMKSQTRKPHNPW
jgi:hypothetical protein